MRKLATPVHSPGKKKKKKNYFGLAYLARSVQTPLVQTIRISSSIAGCSVDLLISWALAQRPDLLVAWPRVRARSCGERGDQRSSATRAGVLASGDRPPMTPAKELCCRGLGGAVLEEMGLGGMLPSLLGPTHAACSCKCL